ncbi:copper amine oxidase N-terminal domain-containing protein [Ammoniphilus sp. 3BR4]|uniref:copper amine oxidase N-terminal domain-containing protein n=1 Tax=Ammoniphilus sp. 3BR4 TaxID=3158265 RepID=UPI003466094F
MKKRIIGLVLLSSFVLSGTVLAVSNGMFKGFQIVNVVIGGNQVKGDVPAIVLDGRTMVPLRTVSESLGANVQWDAGSKTVKIQASNGNDLYYTAKVLDYLVFARTQLQVVSVLGYSLNISKTMNVENPILNDVNKIDESEIRQWQDEIKGYPLHKSEIDTLIKLGNHIIQAKKYIKEQDEVYVSKEYQSASTLVNLIYEQIQGELNELKP